MQQTFQSVQSLSSSISRTEERLESSGTALTVKIQNAEDKLDAQLSKLYDSQETLFNDVDALYENYQDLQSNDEQQAQSIPVSMTVTEVTEPRYCASLPACS